MREDSKTDHRFQRDSEDYLGIEDFKKPKQASDSHSDVDSLGYLRETQIAAIGGHHRNYLVLVLIKYVQKVAKHC